MAYKKINYDEIMDITSKGITKTSKWGEDLIAIMKNYDAFINSNDFTGPGADNMKNYVNELHNTIAAILLTIFQTYRDKAGDYYYGYTVSVDSGDAVRGQNAGIAAHAVIAYDEVNENGSVPKALNAFIGKIDSVTSAANSVVASISDLVSISNSPKPETVKSKLQAARNKATEVNKRANDYEATRANDFADINVLIAQVRKMINNQLGANRIPASAYQSGQISQLVDPEQLNSAMESAQKYCDAIEQTEGFEQAMYVAFNHDDILAEEQRLNEQDKRKWVKYAAVGVAVVGSVALVVVTAGGATPLVCAGVGAAVGGVTMATNKLANEYYEKGNFDEMDWKAFAKDVTVATVVGGVTGYLGAVSQGSAIKQPLQAGMNALKNKAIEKGAKFGTQLLWDVGEGVVMKKPGEIGHSILKDFESTGKEMVTEGVSSFVGGTLTQKFKINTAEKGYGQKLWEGTINNFAKTTSSDAAGLAWDLGQQWLDPDPDKTFESILYENVEGYAKDLIGGEASELISNIDIDIDNKGWNVVKDVVQDTAEGTAESVAGGVSERVVKALDGNGEWKDVGGKIWEEDLDEGRGILKDAGKSAGKHIVEDVIYDDEKQYVTMKRHANQYGAEGKIDLIEYGDKAFTKEDVDAAKSVAGKGAYKDKTVQDILGLSRDTDVGGTTANDYGSGEKVSHEIRKTEKYSDYSKPKSQTQQTVTVDGKYRYSKEYYDAAVKVAGKGDYEGKTVKDLLGIDSKEKINMDNVKTETVKTSDIGSGKKYQYKQDSKSSVTEYHRSDAITDPTYGKKIARELDKAVKSYDFNKAKEAKIEQELTTKKPIVEKK